MVPLVCLLLVVPFVAAGNNDMMNQWMQQQMMQMMSQKGWGGNMGGSMSSESSESNDSDMKSGGDWWAAQNSDDYEAYKKWCEERTRTMQEQEQQKALLKQWEEAQAKRKMEAEKEKAEKESHERHESMMAQWKMWQMRLDQQHEFDNLMGKFAEMKHHYMFAVTMEFLKFCKCSDFTDDLQRYFMHGSQKYEGGDDWDLDDLEGIDNTNAQAVAQAIANLPRTSQIKAFFGGLATALCSSGRAYIEQVRSWEKTYKFLDHYV